LTSLASQLNPSYNPSPLRAHVPYTSQGLSLILYNPSNSVISETVLFETSCLLAKISRGAPDRSSLESTDSKVSAANFKRSSSDVSMT